MPQKALNFIAENVVPNAESSYNMNKILIVVFWILSNYVFGQNFTPVKSIDTINLTGTVLFIDSLVDMSPVYFGAKDLNPLIPYYLILVKVDSIRGTDYWDDKLVFRTRNIDLITLNSKISTKLKMTVYESFGMNKPDENIRMHVDSIIDSIDIKALYFYFMEPRPTRSYSLKEKVNYEFQTLNN